MTVAAAAIPMAKIIVAFLSDSDGPGPTSISKRGGFCSSGDDVVGAPPLPGVCAIAVVVGVGVAETAVVVMVEVEVGEDWDEELRTETGRQSVVTLQLEQSKLILPAVEPAVPAMPVNFPETLIVVPVKGIQPKEDDHAFPPNCPAPVLVTPPLEGDRFIQP